MVTSKIRLSITEDWLPRYTGMEIEEFGDYMWNNDDFRKDITITIL